MKLWDALFAVAVIVVLLVLSAWMYELNGRLKSLEADVHRENILRLSLIAEYTNPSPTLQSENEQ